YVRRVNLMLDNIDKSSMSQVDKDHWRSVGYFFRAYKYFELISRFGDVPWIDKVLKEDSPELMGERTPRDEVATHVLENLQFAEQHIKAKGDGKNTINKNVVQALMSRYCLFEGTWRKYHKLGDEKKYIDECVRVSEELIAAFPQVDPSYDALLTTDDLSTYKGIILYKVYATDLITNLATRYERSEMAVTEMPKSTVELYLSSNGKPIYNKANDKYDGDKTMNDEFRNRDRRLLLTVVPPFCMEKEVEKAGSPTFIVPTDPKKIIYNFRGYYDNPKVDNCEYMKLIDDLRAKNLTGKRLPLYNWSSIRLAIYSPHMAGTGETQMQTRSGYNIWRQLNYWDDTKAGHVDRPIFWIDEVLLNLAEASFEKNGNLSQAVADLTINKLRDRAGVAHMNVSEIDASFDPVRDLGVTGGVDDYAVDPVLWEIRRERIVELMCTGSGFYDIRRWKKGPWYINRPQIGAYMNKDLWFSLNKATGKKGPHSKAWDVLELVTKDFAPVSGKEGYLKRYDNPAKEGYGWIDKFYLFPIPTNDLSFNPKLKQNPGWDSLNQ
ncbi:MAG: RagB/SusD family nutrient uptake outer membrane protein, partial [Rikenellaceae bacterium]